MGGEYIPNGRSPGRDVSVQRKKIAKDPDLGKISDNEMATRYGVSRSVSSDVRKGKGIEPYTIYRKRAEPVMDKIKQYKEWLGVYYDTHIARELCVGARSVQRYRKALGLDPGTQPLPDVKSLWLHSLSPI